ncbi:hypothetical protein E1263_11310 [Kribbella antibiotica]|uniref:Secreted protein n=1 Tax=Kribbella antibiotica TaxID=190195 RepID=A0A4R4ZNA6_9ACTN|nr:hypothetical protein [Kribbella antibiotica]TDD60361.1 hypothetical protein E1263_11310 [Kribbella antibiotica]
MKASVLRAVVGVAAVLSVSLVAGPAQATDGPVSARVYTEGSSGSGGIGSASLTFRSSTVVDYTNLKVRDVCPGDNLPVRVYTKMVYTDGTFETDYVGADTNGCGSDGTNLGGFRATSSKRVAKAGVTVCVYNSVRNLQCKDAFRDNDHT